MLVAGRTPSNLESFQAEMQREGWSVRVASVQEVVEQCEVRAECWGSFAGEMVGLLSNWISPKHHGKTGVPRSD